MAVSIANTLTSRLWKGEPKVVIRGKFALGLVAADSKLYFAPSLWFPTDMAVPLVSGTSISVQVLGRSVVAGMDPDSPVYSTDPGLRNGAIVSFDDILVGLYYPDQSVRDLCSQYVPPRDQVTTDYINPYKNNYEGSCYAPKVAFNTWIDYSTSGVSDQEERNAKNKISDLGTVVAPNLRIVLRGALASLDITGITALGFPSDSNNSFANPYGLKYKASHNLWYSQYYSSPPSFSPEGVGWRATAVHIYDNPGLRGHVTAGNVPVIWG